MDLIEVDPKVFVTCRLCLEDLGQFQIVPSVAVQIKYCFDIDVRFLLLLFVFDNVKEMVTKSACGAWCIHGGPFINIKRFTSIFESMFYATKSC